MMAPEGTTLNEGRDFKPLALSGICRNFSALPYPFLKAPAAPPIVNTDKKQELIPLQSSIDKELLDGCLSGDRACWNRFFSLYGEKILRYIRVTAGLSPGSRGDTRIGDTEFTEQAWDHIVDQFLQKGLLSSYDRSTPFLRFLKTVVNRKTIDVLRKRTSEKKLWGAGDIAVSGFQADEAESDGDTSSPVTESLSPLHRVLFTLMLCRYHDLSGDDLIVAAEEAKVSPAAMEKRVEKLRENLSRRCEKGDRMFEKAALCSMQIRVLQERIFSGTGETDRLSARLAEKDASLDKLMELVFTPNLARSDMILSSNKNGDLSWPESATVLNKSLPN